jgi:two-component system sensor histidine kinase VicK
MKSRLTIKSRLFFAIAAILVSSYTILFFLSIFSIKRFNDEEITKDLENSLRFTKSQFNARPEMVSEALKLPVSAKNIQRLFSRHDSEGLSEAVKRWKQSLEFIEMFTLLDSDLNVIVRSNGKNGSNSFLKGPLLESLLDRREPFITTELINHQKYCEEVSSDVCQALPGDKEVMVQLVIVPVADAVGNLLGFIVTGDDINRDTHLPYQQLKVFGKSVEMLITQLGEPIASTMSIAGLFASSLQPDVLQSLKNGFSFSGKTLLHEKEYEMIAEPIHSYKGDFIGSIAVALEKSRFSSIQNENFRNLFICAVLSISGIFFLSYLIAWKFTAPIRRFSDAVKSIESGDYSAKLQESDGVEFKVLAEAFNRMSAVLSEHDSTIVNQNKELTQLNEELESVIAERAQQLEAESGLQKAIVKSLADGLVVTDSNHVIIQLNPAAERLLGKKAAKMVGKPIFNLCDELGFDELKALIGRCSTSDSEDGEAIVKDNGQKSLKFTATGLKYEEKNNSGLLIGIRDVTADGEVDRLKSGFIAKISHELKTPLTSMKGSLEFILKKGKWLTGVEREMLGVCHRNAERLISQVSSILELSRIEAGQISILLRPVQIGEVALYAIEEIKGAALSKNISLVNEVGVDLPKVSGDYVRLGRVLSNLLSNAIKFSPADSVVHLFAEINGGFLALSVADSGKTIPGEEKATLFSRFRQVGRPEEAEASGSGLGLAISKEIITRHGGSIYHSPGASGGNVFTFTVPLYGEQDVKG